jgi:hypothetical protein
MDRIISISLIGIWAALATLGALGQSPVFADGFLSPLDSVSARFALQTCFALAAAGFTLAALQLLIAPERQDAVLATLKSSFGLLIVSLAIAAASRLHAESVAGLTLLIATLVSWIAIERDIATIPSAQTDVEPASRSVGREMALAAAHQTALRSLTGRRNPAALRSNTITYPKGTN